MTCPACNAGQEATEESAGLAHCAQCGHVWELAVPAIRQSAALDRPPTGVQQTELPGGGVELRLPWNYRRAPAVHSLALVLLSLAVARPSILTFLIGTLTAAAYYALLRNVTTLRIRPGEIDVSHGPVPFPFDASGVISASDLGALHIEDRAESGIPIRYKDHSFFTLKAGHRVLLSHWIDRERLSFVARSIAHHAGVACAEGPPASTELVGIRSAPPGVTVSQHSGVTEIALPWNAQMGPRGTHLLWLVIAPMLWMGGLLGIMGLAVLVLWLYLATNQTMIRIRDGAAEVTRGPLPTPFWPDVHLDTRDRRMEVHTTTPPIGRRRSHYHTLRAGSKLVLAYWDDERKVRYVQQCIDSLLR